MKNPCRNIVGFLIGSGCAASWCFSQTPVSPPTPADSPPQEGRIRFAVSVETVTLDVVVVDKKGRFVPGLKPEAFEVLEDGERQDLSFFTAQFTPVTTLLLLDSSSSVRSNLGAIQTAAYLFAQNLSEGDRVRIGLFNHEIRFGTGFSDSIAEHLTMLRSMKPEGKTLLYDAIIAALQELSVVDGRKSLLVFTDGDDSGPDKGGSVASMEDAIEAAKDSEVTIYTVGFTGLGPKGIQSVNEPFLTTLAQATGGRAFFPKKVEEVKKAFAEVQQDLHRHYRLAYVPATLDAGAGSWRNIQVRIQDRQDLVVRTRQGYYTRTGPSS